MSGSPEPAASLFRQAWWLDAVAPDSWASRTAGEDEAHISWQLQRTRLGLVRVVTPPLTRLGPCVTASAGSYASQLSRQKRLLGELIQQLPTADQCRFVLSTDEANWLPFHWAGFTSTSRMTYVLPDISSEEVLWNNLTDKTRNVVRRGRREVQIRSGLPSSELVRLVTDSLTRQGVHDLDSQLVLRLHDAVVAHAAGTALYAVDRLGRAVAGALVVWDAHSAYYILAGATDEGRRLSAQSTLLWEAVLAAGAHANRFDFEGSMLASVEPVFRGFGGRQVPYLVVERTSRRYALARLAKSLRR